MVAHICAVETPKNPKGLTLDEHRWGRIYKGDETSLVAAGLVFSEWLPGKSGNPKLTLRVAPVNGSMQVLPSRSYASEKQREGMISIRRRGKSKYEVWICHSAEEQEKLEMLEKIKAAHEAKAERLAWLPANADEYRQNQIEHTSFFKKIIPVRLGGYGFSDDFLSEFDNRIDDLIQAAQQAQVYFDPDERKEAIAEIERRVMEDYPEVCFSMTPSLKLVKPPV